MPDAPLNAPLRISSLAALIIVKNEAENLPRVLGSLDFCEEVWVIDTGSSDSTLEIAQSMGAKTATMPWRGFSETRNATLALTSLPYILSIDADEEVTAELALELKKTLASPGIYQAWRVPRKTLHFGRWIRFGGWYPNYQVRLFSRLDGRWEGGELHEYWKTGGRVGTLRSSLLHHSFRDLADQVDRNNLYSSLGADRLDRLGRGFTLFHLLIKPWTKFFETYVWKLGFLDGYPGFIISVSASYSVFLKWAKLWEKKQNAKQATL